MKHKDNILIWVNTDNKEKSLNYGTYLSHKLNLYLTTLYIYNENVPFLNNNLNSESFLTTNIKDIKKTNLQNKIKKLKPTLMLVLINHKNRGFYRILNNIIHISSKLNTPILTVPEDCSLKHLSNIITHIDYSRKSKDRIIWANYLGKQLSAPIEVIFPTEKDDNIINKITNNIYFAEKLFKQSKNNFKISSTTKQSEELTDYTISLAERKKFAIVMVNTKGINLIPRIFKPYEIRIIEKCRKNPVLIIPPNENFLIPCH